MELVQHPGCIIRQILKSRGQDAKGITSLLNVSAAALSNVMTGKKPVSIELAFALEEWLKDEPRPEQYTAFAWLTAQLKYDIEVYKRQREIEAAAKDERYRMKQCTDAYEAVLLAAEPASAASVPAEVGMAEAIEV